MSVARGRPSAVTARHAICATSRRCPDLGPALARRDLAVATDLVMMYAVAMIRSGALHAIGVA
jgi:hypothetical protein